MDYFNNSNSDYKSGSAKTRDMSTRAFNIEKQSFDIIESEIGDHDYDKDQWADSQKSNSCNCRF